MTARAATRGETNDVTVNHELSRLVVCLSPTFGGGAHWFGGHVMSLGGPDDCSVSCRASGGYPHPTRPYLWWFDGLYRY